MPKALDTLCLGLHGQIPVGAEVPATYEDVVGTHDTDFERLLELGLIDKLPRAKPAEAKAAAEPQAPAKAKVPAKPAGE